MNLGWGSYELVQCHSIGFRNYVKLAGLVNGWDIVISFIWIVLFIIRMVASFSDDVNTEDDDEPIWDWDLSQTYMMLWAIQAAIISARSLVLFETTNYFGKILRMISQLLFGMTAILY